MTAQARAGAQEALPQGYEGSQNDASTNARVHQITEKDHKHGDGAVASPAPSAPGSKAKRSLLQLGDKAGSESAKSKSAKSKSAKSHRPKQSQGESSLHPSKGTHGEGCRRGDAPQSLNRGLDSTASARHRQPKQAKKKRVAYLAPPGSLPPRSLRKYCHLKLHSIFSKLLGSEERGSRRDRAEIRHARRE